MPFKSEAQRRWMYANKPEMAKRWSKDYQDGGYVSYHYYGGFEAGRGQDRYEEDHGSPSVDLTVKDERDQVTTYHGDDDSGTTRSYDFSDDGNTITERTTGASYTVEGPGQVRVQKPGTNFSYTQRGLQGRVADAWRSAYDDYASGTHSAYSLSDPDFYRTPAGTEAAKRILGEQGYSEFVAGLAAHQAPQLIANEVTKRTAQAISEGKSELDQQIDQGIADIINDKLGTTVRSNSPIVKAVDKLTNISSIATAIVNQEVPGNTMIHVVVDNRTGELIGVSLGDTSTAALTNAVTGNQIIDDPSIVRAVEQNTGIPVVGEIGAPGSASSVVAGMTQDKMASNVPSWVKRLAGYEKGGEVKMTFPEIVMFLAEYLPTINLAGTSLEKWLPNAEHIIQNAMDEKYISRLDKKFIVGFYEDLKEMGL